MFCHIGGRSITRVAECFNDLAASAGDVDLEYRDPVSKTSYLSSTGCKSMAEYLIRRMGVINFFKPEDLHPSCKFSMGDVRINLMYMLHPHVRPKKTVNPSVTDTSKRLVSHCPGHVFGGALFQRADLPDGLCEDIRRLRNSLLPEKVWHDMHQCKTAQSLVRVMQRNLDLFGTVHHDLNGRFSKGVVRPTAESTSKQPRRATFSCSITPCCIFPQLGTRVQRLFSSIFQMTSDRTTSNRMSLVLGGVLHISLTFNFKLLPVVSMHVPADMAKHQQLDSDCGQRGE